MATCLGLLILAGPPAVAQLPPETVVDGPDLRGISYLAGERLQGLGRAAASVGDVNGDDRPDLLLAAESAGDQRGRVYLFLGGARRPLRQVISDGTPDAVTFLSGSDRPDQLGQFVAGAGDVDGDGFQDFLIGAPQLNLGPGPAGGVFLVFGSAGLAGGSQVDLLSGAATVLSSDSDLGAPGSEGAGVGDVDGDGFDDLALGVPDGRGAAGGGLPPGKVLLIFGGPHLRDGESRKLVEGPGGVPHIEILGPAPGAELGRSIAAAGDIDGDHLPDFLLGAPGAAGGNGAVYAVFGRAGFSGPLSLEAPTGERVSALTSVLPQSRLGAAIAGGTDVDGDGRSDLLLGLPGLQREGAATGGACLVFGGPVLRSSGTTAVPTFDAVTFRGTLGSLAGASVAFVPDLEGEDRPEVLLGAPGSGNGRGACHLIYDGGSRGEVIFLEQLDPGRGAAFRAASPQSFLGQVVVGLPDRDGDLRGNFLLCAPGMSPRQVPGDGAAFEVGVPANLSSPAPRDLRSALLSGGRVRLTWTLGTVYGFQRVLRDGVEIAGRLPGSLQQLTDISPGAGRHVYQIEADDDPTLRSNRSEIDVRGLEVRELECHQIEGSLEVLVTWFLGDRYEQLSLSVNGRRTLDLSPEATSARLELEPGEHFIEVFDPTSQGPPGTRARCSVRVSRPRAPLLGELDCTVQPGAVHLGWQARAEYSSYRVARGEIVLATLPAGSESFVDDGAPPGLLTYTVVGLDGVHPGPAASCEVQVPTPGGPVLSGRVVWALPGSGARLPLLAGRVRAVDPDGGEALGGPVQLDGSGQFVLPVAERRQYLVVYEVAIGAARLDCAISTAPESIVVSSSAAPGAQGLLLEVPVPVVLAAASGAESSEGGLATRWRALGEDLDGHVFHQALVLPPGVARGASFLGNALVLLRENLASQLGSAPGTVDLVAYGAAGLAARAYLAGTAGTPLRRLVLLGCPNLGTSRGHPEARAELTGHPLRLPGNEGAPECSGSSDRFSFSSALEQTPELAADFNLNVTLLRGAEVHLVAGNGGIRALDRVLGCEAHDNRVCVASALGGVPEAATHVVPEDHEELGRASNSLALVASLLLEPPGGGGGEVAGEAGQGVGGAVVSTPPSGAYSGVLEPGGAGDFPLSSDTSESIIIILHSEQPGGLRLRVQTPGGLEVDSSNAGAHENVDYQTYGDGEGHILQAFTFEPCEVGTYVALLENPVENEAVQYSLEAYLESGLELTAAPEPVEISPGERVQLAAQLTRGGAPEAGATVEARVWRPDGSLETISLEDDGATPDAQALDGISTGFTGPQDQPGIHEVEVAAVASAGPVQLYRREASTQFRVRSNLIAFEGAVTASAHDDDGDGMLDWLAVDAPVVSRAPGVFLALGRLTDLEGIQVAEGGILFGLSGAVHENVRLEFAGADIRAARRNGPYRLQSLRLLDGTAGFVEAAELQDALVTEAYTWNAFAIGAGGTRFIRGDANRDGRTDISDVLSILEHLFGGGQALGCLDSADADGDAALGITDPIFLLEFLFLGRSGLPAPFPTCGAAERLGCAEFSPCKG